MHPLNSIYIYKCVNIFFIYIYVCTILLPAFMFNPSSCFYVPPLFLIYVQPFFLLECWTLPPGICTRCLPVSNFIWLLSSFSFHMLSFLLPAPCDYQSFSASWACFFLFHVIVPGLFSASWACFFLFHASVCAFFLLAAAFVCIFCLSQTNSYNFFQHLLSYYNVLATLECKITISVSSHTTLALIVQPKVRKLKRWVPVP